jgi:curved DNA-binding protein CbpA
MQYKFIREYKYYKILGLNKDASIDNIKRAYRLIIRKYHPDVNKDPNAAEVAKKINEAYGVLSDPEKRLIYDNSEAECPKCWTPEVRQSHEEDSTALRWTCKHCGCNFTYVEEKKEKEEKEKAETEYEQFVCPRCGKPLIFDDSVELFRCKNKACSGGKGVFSRFELKRYYSSSSKGKKSNEKPSGYQNKESSIKGTENKQERKGEFKEFVLSANEKLALKFVCGISILLTAVLLYLLLFSFSLLILGLFIILLGFSLLSWYINRYPKIISTIKSLISLK